jgi:hypothetical protein
MQNQCAAGPGLGAAGNKKNHDALELTSSPGLRGL